MTEEDHQYLTFLLGGEMFAIAILNIKEIIEYGSLTEVPMMPDFIRGVINLRGSVVPIVDLHCSFGMPATQNTVNSCIIVVEVLLDNEIVVIGALADQVEEVIDLEPDQIQPGPRLGTTVNTDFVRGMGRRENGFIVILDIDRVFSGDQMEAIRAGK